MIYLALFLQFFHIGLFSFGGGYATLPFLYHIAETTNWYTPHQLSDMIAISSITPGPVGVNVATFAGYATTGLLGAFIATFAVILPSYIIVVLISKVLEIYKTNKYVQAAIYALKPAGCGLLAAVGINMVVSNTNFLGMLFLGFLFYLSTKRKWNPVFYLGISALFGLIAGLFNLTA